MGAFAGVYGKPDAEAARAMLGKMTHRGPDERGFFSDGNLALACVRMATDGERVSPPVSSGESTFVAFDGYLTNGDALRKKIGSENMDTRSDSETVLRLYELEGRDAIRDLRGGFALAIYDKGDLTLARDPWGIKPLYYDKQGKKLAFASEIKGLLETSDTINTFPPGHILVPDKGLRRYIGPETFTQAKSAFTDPNDAAQELKRLLKEAVNKQLPDVKPHACLLSGGLDSSVVAVFASQVSDDLHTFSVGVEGSEDIRCARLVAEHIGSKHHERIYDLKDMLEVLPDVIRGLESFDTLLVRSSIANFMASKMASEHSRVALCGEGGDELFAGYSQLKKINDPGELRKTLIGMTFGCDSTGLQRVDRMNVANGVEGRMPFLDPKVVEFAFSIPAEWKIAGAKKIEKWIVRKAVQGLLPPAVVWRKKAKFARGAGSYEMVAQYAEEKITGGEFSRNRKILDGFELESKEQLLYYRIFRQFFDNESVIRQMGRTEPC
jgi:asparagine synthase (glutamine-hydrolysing)